MPESIKYTCANCGEEHEEWPALSYLAPLFYDELSDEEKESRAELSSDFCIIHNGDEIHRFIRATLTQKVIDHCENMEYGLWVSLSEKSFEDYKSNFDNDDHEARYFGWLSNNLPGYKFESIPTTVVTRTGGSRPDIIPHNDFDHPFVRDYYNGITKEEAERRIFAALNKT